MLRAMRYIPLVALVLVACGGDDGTTDGDDCETLAPIDVTVKVLDPSSMPDAEVVVVDAPVELDGEPCTANGDGTYLCVADPEGENQLSIIDTRYDVHAEFLILTFECEPGIFSHQVQLGAMMGS
jgi:hypothetical protein